MIGWNVDVGYIDGDIQISSLNDVTWTDKNKKFTVATAPVLEQVPSSPVWDYTSPLRIAEQLEMIFGEDYYTLYSILTNYNELRYNGAKNMVPSTFLMFPVFNELSIQSVICPFIYFKSLNRAVQVDRGSGAFMRVYEVKGTDLILLARPVSDNLFPNICHQSAHYWWIPGYTDGMDLSDPSIHYNLLAITAGDPAWTFYYYHPNNSTGVRQFIGAMFSKDSKPDFEKVSPDNPYGPGGDSGEGGGNGSFDGDSDQISDSSLPSLSSSDTGFTRLYTPTLTQVQSLARYLWTDESIVETLWNVVKRYFEDPMQAFISFSIVPVPVPVAGQEEFKVLFIPTGVMLNTVANQFVDVDCGTFELREYYGSALDYSPNTKVSCYLPYIGTVSLNTDDVMGRTLQVKYRVDICSGSCVAKILVDGNVIYQFPGCCSIPIPFSSSDFSSYGSAIISAVKTGVAVAAAGAGMSGIGASVLGMDASQQSGKTITTRTVQTARNPATGRQITTGTEKVTKEISGTEASLSGIAQTGISNTANAVTASKTIVERSGSFSGNSGYLGVRRPYLIIERPRMCMPSNYQSLNGFPSMITLELGSCKGFTRVQQVQLTGFYATNPEQAEILQLLKSGVIF